MTNLSLLHSFVITFQTMEHHYKGTRVTTLLTHAKLNGEIKANAVVLECDELNVRHILPFIPVTDFVVNNFFRDR